MKERRLTERQKLLLEAALPASLSHSDRQLVGTEFRSTSEKERKTKMRQTLAKLGLLVEDSRGWEGWALTERGREIALDKEG